MAFLRDRISWTSGASRRVRDVDRPDDAVGNWDPESLLRLRACDFFVPLVSTHALSCEYTLDQEIAIIRERQTRGERVCFYPLLLTPAQETAFEPLGGEDPRGRLGMRLSDCSG